VIGSD
jgi:RNA recognition motif-containing protein